jgi:hypothetical protein
VLSWYRIARTDATNSWRRRVASHDAGRGEDVWPGITTIFVDAFHGGRRRVKSTCVLRSRRDGQSTWFANVSLMPAASAGK